MSLKRAIQKAAKAAFDVLGDFQETYTLVRYWGSSKPPRDEQEWSISGVLVAEDEEYKALTRTMLVKAAGLEVVPQITDIVFLPDVPDAYKDESFYDRFTREGYPFRIEEVHLDPAGAVYTLELKG